MLLKLSNELSSPIEQELFKEEKKFQDALKADAEFHVLKSIRQKIKQLKAELSEQRMHSRSSFDNSGYKPF